MNSELKEKLENLDEIRAQLQRKLNKAVETRKDIIDKVNAGVEVLTKEEQEQNLALVQKINSLRKRLALFAKLDEIKELRSSIKKLTYASVSDRTKKSIKDKVLNYIDFVSSKCKEKQLANSTLTEDEAKSYIDTRTTLQNNLKMLNSDLEVCQRRGFDASEIYKEIAEINTKIAVINNYAKAIENEDRAKKDLELLTNQNISKEEKANAINNFENMFDKLDNYVIALLENDIINNSKKEEVKENKVEETAIVPVEKAEVMELPASGTEMTMTDTKDTKEEEDKKEADFDEVLNFEDIDSGRNLAEELDKQLEELDKKEQEETQAKKSLKVRTKEKLAKLTEKLKKNKRAIFAVGGAIIIGATVLIASFKACSNNEKEQNSITDENNELDNNNTLSNGSTIEEATPTPLPLVSETVQDLIEVGYSEYAARLMEKNFSKETLDEILKHQYFEYIEDYAAVEGFNFDYKEDYENARTIYNITAEDAVDYVNRAYKIQEVNLFEDISIIQVVEVVMDIDNRSLFADDNNSNVATLLSTAIGQNVENALWLEPTEEDVKKMEALPYLAKDGTDLNLYLEELKNINKRILANIDDNKPKNDAYLYLKTFINSFDEYDNMTYYEEKFPESDFGEVITDEVLKEKASVKDSHDWLVAYKITSSFAGIYTPADYVDEEFAKWDELWMRGETALASPKIQDLCGESRTLGGE